MKLMYSCRKVADLLLQEQDRPLRFFERLQLRLHRSRCPNCTSFGDQLQQIRELLSDRSWAEADNDDGEVPTRSMGP